MRGNLSHVWVMQHWKIWWMMYLISLQLNVHCFLFHRPWHIYQTPASDKKFSLTPLIFGELSSVACCWEYIVIKKISDSIQNSDFDYEFEIAISWSTWLFLFFWCVQIFDVVVLCHQYILMSFSWIVLLYVSEGVLSLATMWKSLHIICSLGVVMWMFHFVICCLAQRCSIWQWHGHFLGGF